MQPEQMCWKIEVRPHQNILDLDFWRNDVME